jgi:hypothetical protein
MGQRQEELVAGAQEVEETLEMVNSLTVTKELDLIMTTDEALHNSLGELSVRMHEFMDDPQFPSKGLLRKIG